MIWFKRQKRIETRISQLNNGLVRSFLNVKNDTKNIFQWLSFLYQKNMEQENQLKEMKIELSYMPKKPEDIKNIIENYYSFDHITEKIKLLNEKIDNIHLKSAPLQTHPDLHEIKQRLKSIEEQKKATIREKVVKRVTKNSKEYVKSLIMSYIRKHGQISSLQLKEMVVHDQDLCSKSSFYRLLEELEALEEVGIAKKGKQKFYIHKQTRTH